MVCVTVAKWCVLLNGVCYPSPSSVEVVCVTVYDRGTGAHLAPGLAIVSSPVRLRCVLPFAIADLSGPTVFTIPRHTFGDLKLALDREHTNGVCHQRCVLPLALAHPFAIDSFRTVSVTFARQASTE